MYYVYLQTGWWEYFCPSSCYWTKHMTAVVCCDCSGTCYKWSWFQVTNHNSGTFTVKASQFLPPGNWCQSAYCGSASSPGGVEERGTTVLDAASR